MRDFAVTAWPGVLITLVALVACEIGFRAGRYIKPRLEEISRFEIMTIQSATLALMALLISFAFSMSAASLSNRKQVVLNEAAVIARAYQAADLLPDATGSEIRSLVMTYIDTRVDLYNGRLIDEAALRDKLLESDRIGKQIWKLAAGLARQNPQSNPVTFALGAFSELRQLNPRRIATLVGTVPSAMFYALALTAMIAMGWVGCGVGLGARRSVVVPLVFAVLFGAIVAMISDLDQPRHGMVRVSQRALTDLKDSLRPLPPDP